MKHLLTSATLASLFVAAPALAAEAKDDSAKSVVPYGIIQAKYYLHESNRDVGTEALTEIVRAGLRGKHGAALAGLEFGFTGNAVAHSSGSTAGKDLVIVRGAWLGFELPTSTTLKIGRVRPGGAAGYGTDATWLPQGFGGVDGVYAKQALSFGDIKIEASGGVYNSLRSMAYSAEYLDVLSTKGTMVNTSWNKPEKAFIGHVSVAMDAVKALVWYGHEKNAIIGAAYKTTQGTNDAADKTEIKDSGLTVADLTHIEASLGFDRDNYGFGVFLEQNVIGARSSAALAMDEEKEPTTGKLTVGAETAKEKSVLVYGTGANLNSKEFGVTNIFAQDDAFTFGVSATTTQVREDGVSVANQKNNDQRDISASVSYALNGLDLALVYAHNTSNNRQNADSKGKPVHAAQQLYVNAVWEF